MLKFTKMLTVLLFASMLVHGCRTYEPVTVADMDASDEYVTRITTAEEFEAQVLKAQTPVLVDFYATWCGPCQVLAPRIHKLAHEYKGRARFIKVNAEESADLATRYNVRGYPTVIIFAGGKAGKPIVGLYGADHYKAALEKAIAETN